MRYPKQWNADRVSTGWYKNEKSEGFALRCVIVRPGTVDDGRPVRIALTHENVVWLIDSLSKQLAAHPKV